MVLSSLISAFLMWGLTHSLQQVKVESRCRLSTPGPPLQHTGRARRYTPTPRVLSASSSTEGAGCDTVPPFPILLHSGQRSRLHDTPKPNNSPCHTLGTPSPPFPTHRGEGRSLMVQVRCKSKPLSKMGSGEPSTVVYSGKCWLAGEIHVFL